MSEHAQTLTVTDEFTAEDRKFVLSYQRYEHTMRLLRAHDELERFLGIAMRQRDDAEAEARANASDRDTWKAQAEAAEKQHEETHETGYEQLQDLRNQLARSESALTQAKARIALLEAQIKQVQLDRDRYARD
jgi:chromosome segregation ATPase